MATTMVKPSGRAIPTRSDGAGASLDPESQRLAEDERRERNWKRFGPYLAERQWGTVREDYSEDGRCWDYLPHDHARSRAYRWGEDGLLGWCDRQGRLCFALALWNGQDPILKERLFGLGGPEGNHGEDVKELYYYLDSTPTHSYARALYKYPQRAYPYRELVEENRRRGKSEAEYELADTGVFEGDRYFDVFASYAKADPEDLLIELTIANRGPEAAPLYLLPTLWFRNTWSWGRHGEGYLHERPRITRAAPSAVRAAHPILGAFELHAQPLADGRQPQWLFTENETNHQRLFGFANAGPYVKDAFHEHVVRGRGDAVNPAAEGSKAAALYELRVPARGETVVRLRLARPAPRADAGRSPFADFAEVFARRRDEADRFYEGRSPGLPPDDREIVRQGYAGLLWSKQFYHYDQRTWLDGDPAQPPPPPRRRQGRNHDWRHLYNRDVISMPDKWEYPWYAAWDLAFHMIPLARIDPTFAKEQLLLMLREWYMHPNGQLPAYEFAFGDVNPPVHAWAAWRVYKIAVGPDGRRDRHFLARVFQKLLLNFTWWVNRKDAEGKNIFAGGFLGLDNIGVFDRSQALPMGERLEQADGTAWMAFYGATMLSIALELAKHDPAYEDMASKFFEHFVGIADAINTLGGHGLWNEADGFYYDQLDLADATVPLRVRSLVSLLPLIAVEVLEDDAIDRLPAFKKRMRWFLENRRDLAAQVSFGEGAHGHVLLAIPSRRRLERVLRPMLDEREFLSPFGLRSLSRVHERAPYSYYHLGQELRVDYAPGESSTGLFGGNSNWRGPVWFPVNYLLIEALERYHHFFGDELRVECPTGSGRLMNLGQVAGELSRRLAGLFRRDADGARPCHGGERRYADDPHFRELLLFHECFHGETGRGIGASHQTGWTALVLRFLEDAARPPATRHARRPGAGAATGEHRP
jgi:hypothetical protein